MSRNSLNNFDKRNVFNLSHPVKTTLDMGQLVPVMCEQVFPGDVWKMNTDAVVRAAPMLAPIMHKVDLFTHSFFVPMRLLWEDWENFITGGKNGDDASVKPTIKFPEGVAENSLGDYLGFPTGVEKSEFDALPFRAYAKIYNDWYRPENLEDEIPMAETEGEDTETNTELQYRCWSKDYFTNALPWPQRGEATFLPLGTQAPVIGNGKALGLTDGNYSGGFYGTYGQGVGASHTWVSSDVYPDVGSVNTPTPLYGATGVVTDPANSGLKADLSSATAITVDALRTAIQTQQWAYLAARAGYRYIEWVQAFFGQKSSDARLQRSEYLGGGRSPILISEVLQTSSTDNTSPQGNMSGHGISASRSHTWKKNFEEHGIVITLMSIMPKAGYFQGLDRQWTYKTRYDFPNPIFSHLGEQAVMDSELYYEGSEVEPKIFGYSPRFQEVRYKQGKVHGAFRSSLKYWHLDRDFAEQQVLNADFVKCNPSKRIFAVETEPGFLAYINHNIKAVRPFPKYGNPGLMDHY